MSAEEWNGGFKKLLFDLIIFWYELELLIIIVLFNARRRVQRRNREK